MSTFSHTDWTVNCDTDGCIAQGRTDQDASYDYTATGVRKILRRRGWLVNVPNPDPEALPRRLDYCPEHKSRNA